MSVQVGSRCAKFQLEGCNGFSILASAELPEFFNTLLDDLPDFIAGRADPYTLACNLHDEIQSRFDTLAKRTADHINRIAETIAEGRLLPKNEGYSAGTRDGAASSDTDSIADSKPFADMESGKAKGV